MKPPLDEIGQEFSSAKAWRGAMRLLKFAVGMMFVVVPLAMLANVLEGKRAIDPIAVVFIPLLILLMASPGFAWWLFLRVSELTIRSKKSH